MKKIHPTAILEGEIQIGDNCEIGPYSIISGKVIIGEGTKISSHVRIEGNVVIGRNNRIYSFAYIGGDPQDVSYKGEESYVQIGDDNIIREYVTIHRATGQGNFTIVGNNNYIMAYTHLAHNVRVGSHCIIVNAAQLAGYVEVHDHAFISGLVGVHQFTRIGAYAIVGAGVKLTQDAPPFMMIAREPARVMGLNIVGLRRKKFDSERINVLRRAFNIIYRRGYSIPAALEVLREELPFNDDVKYLIEFFTSSKRGVLRRSSTDEED
ncbi:MAG: acyl-ACP--UDP-N-acetylglucosamine O-acyltransferase [candidate division WOR-3 bacterium]